MRSPWRPARRVAAEGGLAGPGRAARRRRPRAHRCLTPGPRCPALAADPLPGILVGSRDGGIARDGAGRAVTRRLALHEMAIRRERAIGGARACQREGDWCRGRGRHGSRRRHRRRCARPSRHRSRVCAAGGGRAAPRRLVGGAPPCAATQGRRQGERGQHRSQVSAPRTTRPKHRGTVAARSHVRRA